MEQSQSEQVNDPVHQISLAPLIVNLPIRNKIIHLQQVSRVAPFSRVPEGASNGELNKEEGSPGEEHPNTSDQTRQIAH